MLRLHCEQAQLLTDVTLGCCGTCCGTCGEFELERDFIQEGSRFQDIWAEMSSFPKASFIVLSLVLVLVETSHRPSRSAEGEPRDTVRLEHLR